MDEQKTDEPILEQDSQDADDIDTLLKSADPRLKNYIESLTRAKQDANDNSKKQRLSQQALKESHQKAVDELLAAQKRLKEFDDRDKTEQQRYQDRIKELEQQHAEALAAKARLESETFLLSNDVPKKYLKTVGILLQDFLDENPGVDRDTALGTIKLEHSALWPSEQEQKPEPKTKPVVKQSVSTGSKPQADTKEAKPEPVQIARRSKNQQDRKEFVDMVYRTKGIRL